MIVAENLTKIYDNGAKGIEHLTVRIEDGEFVFVVGNSGSGKTTLLKNICGLLRPAHGKIFIRGKDTEKMGLAEIAKETGFVMQNPDQQLFESTVFDEVAFALKHGGLSAKELRQKTELSLAAAGILDKRDVFPPILGRADRIKTVIASVLAMGSKIIILDEPAAGQDYLGCRMIMDLAADLRRQGCTIIMVTHNMSIAAEYAQRLIVLKTGCVYMDGKPEDIFGRTEELALAGILPPQITRLSQTLRKYIPLAKDALTPAELAAMLVSLKSRKTNNDMV